MTIDCKTGFRFIHIFKIYEDKILQKFLLDYATLELKMEILTFMCVCAHFEASFLVICTYTGTHIYMHAHTHAHTYLLIQCVHIYTDCGRHFKVLFFMCTFLAVLDIMLLVVMHHYTVQVVAVGNGDVSKSSSLNGSLGSKSSTTSITANEDGSNTFKYSGK